MKVVKVTLTDGSAVTASCCHIQAGKVPPAPRCGDSDQGIYVVEWMVPRCYGIKYFEKAY